MIVWVETSDDLALVERIRGQVSDLDLALVVQESSPTLQHSTTDPHAFAFVWFTRNDSSSDHIVVHAAAAQSGASHELVREVGDGTMTPRGELGSATLEAAALVVREALRELAATEPPAPAQITTPAPRKRTAVGP
ncbi:MAG TPA: hypothetical protein VGI10_16355 [Polyangiaceae bacterium]